MKEKLVCASCRYKFQQNFKPRHCPNCGKEKVEEDISRGAQDIINDVLDNSRL